MSAAIPADISVIKTRVAVTAADDAQAGRFISFWLIIAAVLLGAAIGINEGRLHWQGLQWLTWALVALIGSMILCRSRIGAIVSQRMINIALLTAVGGQIVHLSYCGIANSAANFPRLYLLCCLLLIVGGLFASVAAHRRFFGSALMIGAFAALGFGAIWAHPTARIDVLEFQRESSAALFRGQNPYSVRYTNVYHPHTEFYGPGVVDGQYLTYSFPYPPMSLFLVAPAHLLGDVRYTHLAAVSIAAALLILAGRGSMTATLAAALLLTSSRTAFVVSNGWTEPLLILLAAFVTFSALRWRIGLWLSLGLFLSVKQYLILLVPLLILLRSSTRTTMGFALTIVLAIFLAGATIAPFYLADSEAFLRGVVKWQMVQPFRYDALSFSAMSAQRTGETATGAVGFIAAGMAILLAYWKSPVNVGGFMAAAAVVFCCFFALNKQAFCNYYLFVIGLCSCAIVGLAASVRLNSTPVELSAAKSAR